MISNNRTVISILIIAMKYKVLQLLVKNQSNFKKVNVWKNLWKFWTIEKFYSILIWINGMNDFGRTLNKKQKLCSGSGRAQTGEPQIGDETHGLTGTKSVGPTSDRGPAKRGVSSPVGALIWRFLPEFKLKSAFGRNTPFFCEKCYKFNIIFFSVR